MELPTPKEVAEPAPEEPSGPALASIFAPQNPLGPHLSQILSSRARWDHHSRGFCRPGTVGTIPLKDSAPSIHQASIEV